MITTANVAIVAHIYYPELWEDIAAYLIKIDTKFDLFITIPLENNEQVTPVVQAQFPKATIKILPNKGMDILPFLTLIPELVDANYQAVCKLHTKKGEGELGSVWRQALLQSLVGSSKTIEAIDIAFAEHDNLAMVGTGAFYLSAQKVREADNTPLLQQLYNALAISPPVQDWGFFAGSMFWVKPMVLLPLALAVAEHSEWFQQSTAKRDGAIEHALERIMGLIPLQNQMAVAHLLPDTASKLHFTLHLMDARQAQKHIGQAYISPLLHQYQALRKDRASLLKTRLFNYGNYLKQFPDLSGMRIDLPSHYLLIGRFQQAAPHPNFDPKVYQQLHQSQLNYNEDTFLHYVRYGAMQNLSLRLTKKQQQEEAPGFRYQVLNTVLIDWLAEKHKMRDGNKVSIIIPVLDQSQLTQACIESLYQFTKPLEQFEIIIVDNGSKRETQRLLQVLSNEYTNLSVLRNEENLNFSLGCNLGFHMSTGENVIFLNNDTEVTNNWLEPLLKPLACENISAVQPRLLYPDGKVQCIGIVFSDKSSLGYPIYQGLNPKEPWISKSREFQAVTGACMALRASDFILARGFNANYVNGQEDVDLCLRLNRLNGVSRSCWYSSGSHVLHKESQTQSRFSHTIKNRQTYIDLWKSKYKADDLKYYIEDDFIVCDWFADREDHESIKTYKPKLREVTLPLTEIQQPHTALKEN